MSGLCLDADNAEGAVYSGAPAELEIFTRCEYGLEHPHPSSLELFRIDLPDKGNLSYRSLWYGGDATLGPTCAPGGGWTSSGVLSANTESAVEGAVANGPKFSLFGNIF